ncbi:MAG: tryptophan-rich sensory protein [Anaerolineales bacterium]|nr:tryptophan-rich sensory protein [Anaerolineales bacterium]
MKDTLRQVVVVLSTLLVIAANGLANALPLNDQTTGEISDRFEVFFVPAGYVFSIWGLIYLALIGYSIYQAVPSQRENTRLRSIGYLYALSCLANIAWLIFWHYELFVLTLIAMLTLLAVLIAIYLRLGAGRNRVPDGEVWFVRVPFSIYLGWITVATIANVTSLLAYLGWDAWGINPEIWAVIMLVAGAVIALAVSIDRGDVAYVLVILWAYAGIAVKFADASTTVTVTAGIMAVIVGLSLFIGVPRYRRRVEGQAVAA